MSSSPYVKLGSRSLDQWKVTELKEELKRRKLATRGLKEDLVKRLDEAVRTERESVVEYADNDASQSDLPSEQANPETNVSAEAKDIGIVMVEKVDQENNDQRGSLEMNLVQETKVAGLEGEEVAEFSAVETSVVMSEKIEIEPLMSGSQLHIDGTKEDGDSTAVINNQGLPHSHENASLEPNHDTQSTQINKSSTSVEPSTEPMENDESKSLNQPDSIVQPLKYQVSEVDPDLGFQVTSDSVSTESVSIIEKNELKVDVITDNVQLEIDLKHEMVQPSSPSRAVLDGGISHPMGVEEPIDKKDSGESVDKNNIGEPIDKKDIGELIEKNDIEDPIDKKDIGEPMDKDDIGEPVDKKDFGEPLEKTDFEEPLDEKVPMEATGVISAENVDGGDFAAENLSLDRSSGDDSMEEDVLDCKQLESDKISDVQKSAMPIGKEDDDVDVVGHDKLVESKASNANDVTVSAPTTMKRKFHDKEAAVANNDTVKKPRRWNAEGLKGSEPHSGNIVTSISPKGLKPSAGTNSIVNEALPKERIVPPSSKPPSNSLRIDRFLRPFTLKAVQELLGKTGTVTSFWMDNIKTHCYVSYSSVEEAQETRNAVYNLQWPPNGGRLLVADFVDAQEVKTRADAPLASPLTPSTNAAPTFATAPPQPSPRQQVPKRQQLVPPPSLPPPPPPPPLSNPPLVRERLNLPPPPPLPEKMEPPIVTLDDLFRKTKAIPRIYYLPLSDDQVTAKLKTHGKNVN